MKVHRTAVGSLLVLLLISNISYPTSASESGAAFLKIGAGARAAGMGLAYTAVAEDASAVYWNPAGIAGLKSREVLAMHSAWVGEMNYGFASYVQPTGQGGVGVGVTYLSQGSLEGRDSNRRPTGDFSASDMAVSLSLGRRRSLGSVGMSVKVIQQRIEEATAQGVALDVGGKIQRPGLPLSLGASLQNLGKKMTFDKEPYALPLTLAAGMAYQAGPSLTLSMDVKRRMHNGATSVSVGSEVWVFKTVALRAGYLSRLGAFQRTSEGSKGSVGRWEGATGLGAGFGMKLSRYQMDYALTPQGELGNIQRISLTAKF